METKEVTKQEKRDLLYLETLRLNPNRWFSGKEFSRLTELTEKKYKLSQE